MRRRPPRSTRTDALFPYTTRFRSLAWGAAGRFDGFWESDLGHWDVAAGLLLVKEAGGFVTDYRGGDRAIARNEFLAANDVLHSKLHKLIAAALRCSRFVRSEERRVGKEGVSTVRSRWLLFLLKKKR